ncbi:hypothetical protein ANN_07696 [Periplaneta americana]|uniref:Uncharacterized protein n=1 Tax=Periplaneta americana TaxID=6978 RepID=A0ABQ8SZB4_PERAM|nr:hypothetical protein ANN_07696 [Periplaneta americana]
MAGLCEGGSEPPGSLKVSKTLGTTLTVQHLDKEEHDSKFVMAALSSLGRAIVKEDEYEKVRWDGIVSIVSWRERVFRLWWEERMRLQFAREHVHKEENWWDVVMFADESKFNVFGSDGQQYVWYKKNEDLGKKESVANNEIRCGQRHGMELYGCRWS